jgi:nucleoside-diphosphate-sugar epimerase
MVRVVITGGLGFVGQELCKLLLKTGKIGGKEIREVLLFDAVEPDPLPEFCKDCRVVTKAGSFEDQDVCHGIVNGGKPDENLSVFHLGGIMSGQGEKDFDLCLRVNLDGTRNMLEAARQRTLKGSPKPRFVFASSAALYGETPEPVTKDRPVSHNTKCIPLNTYGVTKACSELLVNDFTRKNFVDGRSARLPTVIVRPGKPNAATTSCFSGVIREPLHGVDCVLPVGRDLPHTITSARMVVKNLALLHEAVWPAGVVDRAVSLPGIPTTLGALVESMHRVIAPEDHDKLGKVSDKPDPFLNEVVGGMACKYVDHSKALGLGLEEVPDIDTIVREFLEDFGENCVVRARHAGEPPAKKTKS